MITAINQIIKKNANMFCFFLLFVVVRLFFEGRVLPLLFFNKENFFYTFMIFANPLGDLVDPEKVVVVDICCIRCIFFFFSSTENIFFIIFRISFVVFVVVVVVVAIIIIITTSTTTTTTKFRS